jgi:hypothetical protein
MAFEIVKTTQTDGLKEDRGLLGRESVWSFFGAV